MQDGIALDPKINQSDNSILKIGAIDLFTEDRASALREGSTSCGRLQGASVVADAKAACTLFILHSLLIRDQV